MTVKELIVELNHYELNTPVFLEIDDHSIHAPWSVLPAKNKDTAKPRVIITTIEYNVSGEIAR